MKKINKLNEVHLTRLVRKIILEQNPTIPLGYEENFVPITINQLPSNLKKFVEENELLNYGELQRKVVGNEFKYIPKDGSEVVEFTLDEFNIYDKFYKGYEKYKDIIDKFNEFT